MLRLNQFKEATTLPPPFKAHGTLWKNGWKEHKTWKTGKRAAKHYLLGITQSLELWRHLHWSWTKLTLSTVNHGLGEGLLIYLKGWRIMVFTSGSSKLARIVPNSWIHGLLWLNSVDHKTKLKTFGKQICKKRGGDRAIRIYPVHLWNCQMTNLIDKNKITILSRKNKNRAKEIK